MKPQTRSNLTIAFLIVAGLLVGATFGLPLLVRDWGYVSEWWK